MRHDDAVATSTLEQFSQSSERRGLVDATERMARHGAVNTNHQSQRTGSRVSSAGVAAMTLVLVFIVLSFSSTSSTTSSSLSLTSQGVTAVGGAQLGAGAREDGSPRVYVYDVVNAYPHDRRAFTQGLTVCGQDVLCESTGAVHGMKSQVRVTDFSTG